MLIASRHRPQFLLTHCLESPVLANKRAGRSPVSALIYSHVAQGQSSLASSGCGDYTKMSPSLLSREPQTVRKFFLPSRSKMRTGSRSPGPGNSMQLPDCPPSEEIFCLPSPWWLLPLPGSESCVWIPGISGKRVKRLNHTAGVSWAPHGNLADPRGTVHGNPVLSL